jgi:hypothetical protein
LMVRGWDVGWSLACTDLHQSDALPVRQANGEVEAATEQ